MSELNQIVTGDIQTLAFGGEGILRHDGLVIFVPWAAPGDTLQCRLKRIKKSYAFGEIVEIQHKSPLRTHPKCPYFGTCGGCQLQHITYAAQLYEKRIWVEDALKRIGKFSSIQVTDVIPAEHPWAYRRHIDLHLHVIKNHYHAGYIAVDNKTLVEADQCVIFTPVEEKLLHEVQQVIPQLTPVSPDPGKLTLLKEHILHFHFKEMPQNASEVIQKAMRDYPDWKGVIVSSHRKTLHFGVINLSYEVDQLRFQFSTTVFMQNNPEQSVKIYRKILALAHGVPELLDLYCGIGISSLLLARQGSNVTGIEYNQKSIDFAKRNAETNHISNAHFETGAVEEIIHKISIPDFVIVNPPREGLDPKVIETLKLKKPKQIVYISCMPATLARDLRLLCEYNLYTIAECQPYDMFPQTAHVETLVHLKRT